MAKTMEKTREVTGQSFEEIIAGRKSKPLASAFPAVWDAQNAGEFVHGEYMGTEEITPKGSQKMRVYSIRLKAWNANITRSGNAYVPTVDEVISVSGRTLETGLLNLKPGTEIALKFLGLGVKKGKRNPAKLFDAVELT